MAEKRKKKWIQAAGLKEGALIDMAKRAGFTSWQAFCGQPSDKLSPLAKKRCILAQTLSRLNK
jgi:hypothetical protein